MDDKEKNSNFFTYSQSSFSVNSCKCQPGMYCFDFASAPAKSLDQSDTDWNRDSIKYPGHDEKSSGQGIQYPGHDEKSPG